VKIPFVSSIAVLGLLQIIVWFACFLVVGTILKARGYPDAIDLIIPSAVFMREWGLIYTLIPSVWTIWASWDLEQNESSDLSLKGHLIIGVLLLLATVYMTTTYIGLAGTTRMGAHRIADP